MKIRNSWVPWVTASLLLAISVGCSSKEEDTTSSSSTGSSFSSSSSSSQSSGGTDISGSSDSFNNATEEFGTLFTELTFSSTAAKQIAMRQAGATEATMEGYSCEVENSNGLDQYVIRFWLGTIEYVYYLSGVDGSILGMDTTFHSSGYQAPEQEEVVEEEVPVFEPTPGYLTESQSKSIVFMHAGVSDVDVTSFSIYEQLSGSISEYVIAFTTATHTYSYRLIGSTGAITSSISSPISSSTTSPEPTPDTSTTTPSTGTTTPSTGTTTTTPSTGTTTTTPSTGTTTTTPSTGTTTTTPSTGTTTTTPSTPEVTVPDVVVPEVTVPDVVVPEVTTPVAPSLSSLEAKYVALSYTGLSESVIDRLSITEIKDSSGIVYEYQVDFFHQVNHHTYRVDANTGAIRIT